MKVIFKKTNRKQVWWHIFLMKFILGQKLVLTCMLYFNKFELKKNLS